MHEIIGIITDKENNQINDPINSSKNLVSFNHFIGCKIGFTDASLKLIYKNGKVTFKVRDNK